MNIINIKVNSLGVSQHLYIEREKEENEICLQRNKQFENNTTTTTNHSLSSTFNYN